MKPSVQIVISAILPRPKDHAITDPVIRYVKTFKTLHELINVVSIYLYSQTFMYAGSVRTGLFAKRDKGLH